MKTHKEIAKAYLQALEDADLEAVVGLFSAEGKVISPLYGENNARKFYAELFSATTNSKLTHIQTFLADSPPQISLFFHYGWTLSNGLEVDFEVVDILTLDEQGKISELKIIYDTVLTREAWERNRGDSI